jgi:hypothetical protein
VQPQLDFEFAEGLDRLIQVNLLFVERNVELRLELIGD